MNKFKLIKISLMNAILSALYIAIVSWLMTNGQKLFGKTAGVLGGVATLLLFVISATVMGSLILGRPVLMYLDGLKKEALQLFYFTVTWLIIIAIIIFSCLAILR
jgi:hypothetical protein